MPTTVDPIVAIVGRPNAGKSALFNRLLSRRVAIVEDTPGVTRDRLSATCEWAGRHFTLVDTGGLVSGRAEALATEVRRQTGRAIADADLVLFVVDAAQGLTPADEEIAQQLRETDRPVLVVANKIDLGSGSVGVHEFHALGLGTPLPVSATQGVGIGDLLDTVIGALPATASDAERGAEPASAEPEADAPVRVAFLGRPNVGKSSLVNALLGEDRVVVDAAPGTTRDAIDTALSYGGRAVVLIDTAGLRRRTHVTESVEFYSTRRTYDALARADVVVLVVDATLGITEQDQRIARAAYDAGRGVALAVNKWDLLTGYTPADVDRMAQRQLRFLGGVAVCLTSAVSGEGIAGLFDAVFATAAARGLRIATGPLNRLIGQAVRANEPSADGAGRRLHIYYATQAETHPPNIVLFVNNPALFTEEYRRYLERKLRTAFDLRGTPIRWSLRGKRAAASERTLGQRG
ncbi:MAG TPA: ribosome biogenesis GTPase Der [bacterium]|nr:ribosome biogenesis GTPase Der [bacterium]